MQTDTRRLSGPRATPRSLSIVAGAAIALGTLLTTTHASATSLATPTYVRTIGSSATATMYPSGVAVDASGNIYVADTGNYQVDKYAAGATTPSWVVGIRGLKHDVAGTTNVSFTAPRDLATDGTNVYVADTDDAIVKVLKASDGTFVSSARLFNTGAKVGSPIGISVGHHGSTEELLISDGVSGNVYVSDTSFTLLRTIVPTAKNEGTRDAATDSSGDIFTADYRGNKVDMYSLTNNGPTPTLTWGATSGCQDVAKPYGVDVDANNHVYVASSNLEQVKVFTTNGTCLTSINGGNSIGTACKIPPATSCAPNATEIFQLRRVAVGSGSSPLVYLADLWGLKILTYKSTDGTISTAQPVIGNSGYPAAGNLNEPHGIAIAPSAGMIYVSNTVNQRIDRLTLPDGTGAIDWGTKGVQESAAAFNWAEGIGFDPVSGNVWVANTRNNRIDEFGPDGTGPIRELPATGRTNSIFNWPKAVEFDPSGNMYVADTNGSDVQKFSVPTSGLPTLVWKTGTHGAGNDQFVHPSGLAYDPTGKRVLVADTTNNRIVALDATTGAFSIVVSGKGTGAGQFTNPEGVAVDGAGNIWVADTGNDRVQEFTNAGAFLQTFGSYGTSGDLSLNAPQGLAFDAGGLLYVADVNNNRIQVFQP